MSYYVLLSHDIPEHRLKSQADHEKHYCHLNLEKLDRKNKWYEMEIL